ncbi:survival motor neuron protein-like [Huso huso]|uniref:Survival motor neuron protein-like n=1 Tax=Huso huso TaxID=61971 RepID=A0ABR0Y652_HUSHU
MAELDGEIVYQSGRTEVGESFCEDTALVRAYDKAVKPLQSVPAMEREGCHPHVNVPGESEGENETKSQEEEDKGTKVQWQVGWRCCAVWSEDGLVYPAMVRKLLPDRGRCVVRFEGYGNEEEQDFSALLPAQDSEPSDPTHTQDSEPSDPTHTQDSEPSDPTHTQDSEPSDPTHTSEPQPESGQASQWQVGWRCCAVWSEDGLVYPAVVRKLLPDRGRCVVRFEGYGNEEEQDLSALLPAQDSEPSDSTHTQDSEPSSPTQTQDSEPSGPTQTQDSEPTHTTELHEEDGEDESRPESLKPVKKEKAKKQGRSCPERNHAFPFPFPFPPPMPQGYSGGPTFLPLPPPPPPPAFTFHSSNCEGAADEIDVDSLSSMLLSWYLCGYHTGFHLGLQQGRAEAGKNCAKIKQAQLNTNKKLRKNLS